MSENGFPKLRILCVDDNVLIAEALRRRIRDEHALEWAGLVNDSAAGPLDDQVRALRPDVVLMDIDMPGVDTFALVERLASEAPEIRVLMFSGHVTTEYIDHAFDCGAWGYISKNDDVARLMEAIRQVARGEIAMSHEAEAVQRNALPKPESP